MEYKFTQKRAYPGRAHYPTILRSSKSWTPNPFECRLHGPAIRTLLKSIGSYQNTGADVEYLSFPGFLGGPRAGNGVSSSASLGIHGR